jgi:hypothetical protein
MTKKLTHRLQVRIRLQIFHAIQNRINRIGRNIFVQKKLFEQTRVERKQSETAQNFFYCHIQLSEEAASSTPLWFVRNWPKKIEKNVSINNPIKYFLTDRPNPNCRFDDWPR